MLCYGQRSDILAERRGGYWELKICWCYTDRAPSLRSSGFVYFLYRDCSLQGEGGSRPHLSFTEWREINIWSGEQNIRTVSFYSLISCHQPLKKKKMHMTIMGITQSFWNIFIIWPWQLILFQSTVSKMLLLRETRCVSESLTSKSCGIV